MKERGAPMRARPIRDKLGRQRRRDLAERAADLGAESRHGENTDERDESHEQAILDQRGAALFLTEAVDDHEKSSEH